MYVTEYTYRRRLVASIKMFHLCFILIKWTALLPVPFTTKIKWRTCSQMTWLFQTYLWAQKQPLLYAWTWSLKSPSIPVAFTSSLSIFLFTSFTRKKVFKLFSVIIYDNLLVSLKKQLSRFTNLCIVLNVFQQLNATTTVIRNIKFKDLCKN